jgi:REP element-mobilizing transposase RayT
MARRLRLHVPWGFYHVTLRGNHRCPIFFSESDRDLFEQILAGSLERWSARLHAYCWMTNHVHMLIQVSDAPLGRIILRTASAYARRVQFRLATTGHLFERRFHAVLVDTDAYLLTLLCYIHLNPVRAGLVREPGLYPWSSHRDYLGARSQPWLTTRFALGMLASQGHRAVDRYCELLGKSAPLSWGSGALTPNRSQPQILGDDAFVARATARLAMPAKPITLAQLLDDCSARFRLSAAEISSPRISRKLAKARAWLAHQATCMGVASISDVARFLGRSEGAIRQAMQRHSLDALEA